MLSEIFTQLLQRYTTNQKLIQECWQEIETNYSAKNRHYHNLQHLQNMYEQLLPVKDKIEDWDTLLFSLFYHDVVYSATAKDNEEKSAALAKLRLTEIHYPTEKIEKCVQQILATKSHHYTDDNDTNLFTDADLSILGAEWSNYDDYCKAIRKEYAIYPDLLYKPGRRKVLQHFLGMKQIYKTDFFRNKYEATARENMQKEMQLL